MWSFQINLYIKYMIEFYIYLSSYEKATILISCLTRSTTVYLFTTFLSLSLCKLWLLPAVSDDVYIFEISSCHWLTILVFLLLFCLS